MGAVQGLSEREIYGPIRWLEPLPVDGSGCCNAQPKSQPQGTISPPLTYHSHQRYISTLELLAGFLLLAVTVALAEQPAVLVEKGKDHFETEFVPGGRLQLEVRSGAVRISGRSQSISIHDEGRNEDDISDVRVQCRNSGNNARLEISGGPRNDFQIWIEIPRETE